MWSVFIFLVMKSVFWSINIEHDTWNTLKSNYNHVDYVTVDEIYGFTTHNTGARDWNRNSWIGEMSIS